MVAEAIREYLLLREIIKIISSDNFSFHACISPNIPVELRRVSRFAAYFTSSIKTPCIVVSVEDDYHNIQIHTEKGGCLRIYAPLGIDRQIYFTVGSHRCL